MELRRVSLDDPLVGPLLADLTEEYTTRYGPGGAQEMAAAHAREFEPPSGSFVLLLVEGEAVAGGGIRAFPFPPQDGEPAGLVAEVKRMWTHAGHRRRGHASRVLQGLEDEARALGYTRIRLETGPYQPEAQALYSGLGYTRIPVYGSYPDAFAYERSL